MKKLYKLIAYILIISISVSMLAMQVSAAETDDAETNGSVAQFSCLSCGSSKTTLRNTIRQSLGTHNCESGYEHYVLTNVYYCDYCGGLSYDTIGEYCVASGRIF